MKKLTKLTHSRKLLHKARREGRLLIDKTPKCVDIPLQYEADMREWGTTERYFYYRMILHVALKKDRLLFRFSNVILYGCECRFLLPRWSFSVTTSSYLPGVVCVADLVLTRSQESESSAPKRESRLWNRRFISSFENMKRQSLLSYHTTYYFLMIV